jgi:four helix bundle protein
MNAKSLDDLLVYQKALKGDAAVSALLKRPEFSRDFALKDQLRESSGSIPGHIGEGFGQLTDRHFAHYLGIARGSAQETRGHLEVAFNRGYISQKELVDTLGIYAELSLMLTALISYLCHSNRKTRW